MNWGVDVVVPPPPLPDCLFHLMLSTIVDQSVALSFLFVCSTSDGERVKVL